MALASATVLGLWGTQAAALSLGRLVVQSALGEPLRAEIEILDINDEEASSLRPRIALPDAFRANGMEYSASLNGLQIALQKRPDGRQYLRLSNNRPVNEPYVDLILEASWSSGRIVRDYTMLFDPPNLGAALPVAPQAPQVSTVPVRVSPAVEPASAAPAAAAAPTTAETPASPSAPAPAAAAPAAPQPAAAPASTPAPVASKPATPQPAAAGGKRITVKAGDTASRIAMSQKPAEVLLDQMLVAMLRANPEAFIGGNINRLRKGAVIDVPSAAQAETITPDEARQILTVQSKDFNEFRRRLASSAPASAEAVADRKSSGTVQPQVEEKKPAAAPDKLTLSKGSVQAKAAEDQLAKERSAQDAAARAEALSKNVAELEKLSKAAAPAAPAASAAKPVAATQPAAPAPVPVASAPVAAPQIAAPAATPASAPAPASAASAPVKRPAPPPPAPIVEEPSLIDELLDNPMVPAAAGGLVALLAGFAFYRSRQRKNATQVDSVYLESRLQPDSFFGASGGQRVDTNDAGASSSSSMVYSPSQLDAGDDVDPVAEADVYLAYGRDLQAQEILKEALRNHPSRVAIHQKLCEIYAKRRDAKNFNAMAKEAYGLTAGSGPEWEHICELGSSIDPSNHLYAPGGQPSSPAPLSASAPAPEPVRQAAPAPAPVAAAPAAAAAGAGLDLDLDLDFSLDEQPRAAAPAASTMPAPIASAPDNSMDFEAPPLPQLTPEPAAVAPAAAPDNMMNFDLGGLSLDLGTPSEQPEAGAEDPLATKLALADEFKAIGDTDGARALIEEIIAEASGDMKARAQKALAALG